MNADTFRVLVTGSRTWPYRDAVWERLALVLAADLPNGGTLTVVHGDCGSGADHFARWWCTLPAEPGYVVVEERHPAEWGHCTDECERSPHNGPGMRPDGTTYCIRAGRYRNQAMVDLGADLVLAFPLGRSNGTRHCMAAARRAGLRVEEVPPTGPRFTAVEVAEARRAAKA